MLNGELYTQRFLESLAIDEYISICFINTLAFFYLPFYLPYQNISIDQENKENKDM